MRIHMSKASVCSVCRQEYPSEILDVCLTGKHEPIRLCRTCLRTKLFDPLFDFFFTDDLGDHLPYRPVSVVNAYLNIDVTGSERAEQGYYRMALTQLNKVSLGGNHDILFVYQDAHSPLRINRQRDGRSVDRYLLTLIVAGDLNPRHLGIYQLLPFAHVELYLTENHFLGERPVLKRIGDVSV